ncbi:methylmalonyl-CoA mutase subunit beta [Psychroflexus salis]|uniref:Methylmalonyl-CoA mutase n=1 Tax=Psychroflexus salis TaxID=1526574 RepID=A0A916ZPE8_9FLAO|nr:methylmalonyl-CoA mutase subunit beta [Psychroflexus salis]GGE07732.1 methylmalonyl-CoA mutase [Psychroflexus salis]
MNKSLFSQFEAVSAKEWKQQIQVELKGADFNEKLVTKTEDGIDIKPFYHADDVEKFTHLQTSSWKICQAFEVTSETKTHTIVDATQRGAEQIKLEVDSTSTPIEKLVLTLHEKQIQVYVTYKRVHFNELEATISKLSGKAIFVIDPIAKLARTGNWYTNQKTDFAFIKDASADANFNITLQLKHFQQAGATHVQQLAYALAQANEYLNLAEDKEFLNKIKAFYVEVAVGGNYFFEIAKLRSLRVLLYSLLSEYHLEIPIYIFTEPSNRNKTLYDYNVNMLRTTTECMSAILGGADVVCNQNYDAIYQNENEFANRISRNQLLILKNESYFDKVHNPADGSYYIEKITQQLQDKALAIFKDIEQGGGLIKQLFEGKIQKKIKEQETKEQEEFSVGDRKLVGTNAYENKDEKLSENFERNPFMETETRKTLIEPIVEKRLAEEVEKQRINQTTRA